MIFWKYSWRRTVAALFWLFLCLAAPRIHADITLTNLADLSSSGASGSGASPAASMVFLPGSGRLYGTATVGGAGHGSVFALGFSQIPPFGFTPGPLLTNLHSFAISEGGAPSAPVAFVDFATMFGSAAECGISNSLYPAGMGSIYKLATNRTFNVWYRFGSHTNAAGQALDGAIPKSRLIFASQGRLFGLTSQGGANGYANGGHGYGTAFVILTNGANSLTTLHSFTPTEGINPVDLTPSANGLLYGVAASGGASSLVIDADGDVGGGTLFSMDTNGNVAALYSFGSRTNLSGAALDGCSPNPVIVGADGYLYGTTRFGGSNSAVADTNGHVGFGTVFKADTNGALTTLYSFGSVTDAHGTPLDGGNPAGALLQGADGELFGVTTFGGISNVGTIYKITTNGVFTQLHSLAASPIVRFPPLPPGVTDVDIGEFPQAGLTAGPGGFYGSTFGSNSSLPFASTTGSALFSIGPLAPRTVNFSATATFIDGSTNTFSFQTVSLYQSAYHWTTTGVSNEANLLGLNVSNLTISGATLGNAGSYTVVTTNVAGAVTNTVGVKVVPLVVQNSPSDQVVRVGQSAAFAGTAQSVHPLDYQWQRDGANLTNDGRYSGTTTFQLSLASAAVADGGSFTLVFSNVAGAVTSAPAVLTVLPLAATGYGYTSLHGFDITNDGALPSSSVIQGADFNLYGTAYDGGATNAGTVFRMTTNGDFTLLHSFGSFYSNGVPWDGSFPVARLLQGSDGWFYGSCSEGGSNNLGTIFKISPAGEFQTLAMLGSSNVGGAEYPGSPLIQDHQGTFYATSDGAGAGTGVLFSMSTVGNLTTLHTFTDNDGTAFASTLIEEPDSSFVGLASQGGLYGNGSFFKLTSAGVYTNLYFFDNGPEGDFPTGDLAEDDAGNYYGVTTYGAGYGHGAVFEIDANNSVTALHSFGAQTIQGNTIDGLQPEGGLTRAVDGNFYGATLSGGWQNYGTIFRITPQGDFSTVVWFDGVNGSHPMAAPAQGLDGSLYGSARDGGPSGAGMIYRLSIPIPPPSFRHAAAVEGFFNFSWNAIGGRAYQVQYATNLANPDWKDLGGRLTADSLALGISDPVTNQQRFYRVVQMQP
ncbi:MAG TPA: choice-of-anchor tandem repeat GloVer-containing protein [Verrucomicrobiae bacterium]|nr:choice-of-anchor tandem repeat GloVer-containing protein [Verrucomicrobiae bacterium]